jgi:hypothetical protein
MIKTKDKMPPLNKYVLIKLRNRNGEGENKHDPVGLIHQVALFNGEYWETFGSLMFDECDVIEWQPLP